MGNANSDDDGGGGGRIILAEPVNNNGVVMNLEGEAYCGCEQFVHFNRASGIEERDYIEFHLHGQRKRWEWCKKAANNERLNFGVHGQEGLVRVKYFVGGGTFSTGQMLCELSYTLRNPVESLEVPSTIEVGEEWYVKCKMLVIPNSCRVIIRYEGIRIFSRNIMALESTFPVHGVLRLPGEYEIAIIATEGGDTVLQKSKLTVSDFYNQCDVKLHCETFDRTNKIITTQPHKELTFAAEGGILLASDELVVVDISSSIEKMLEKPSHASIQLCDQKYKLGATGMVTLQPHNEGVYNICVCLPQENGSILSIGEWCTLIVSTRAGRRNNSVSSSSSSLLSSSVSVSVAGFVPNEQRSAVAPAEAAAAAAVPSRSVLPPAPLSSKAAISRTASGTSTTEHLCVICHDATVNMLLEPCHHVCFCEACEQSLRTSGIETACPICRQRYRNAHKIYLC